MTFMIVTHILTFVVGICVGGLISWLYGLIMLFRKQKNGGDHNATD
jgi:hypothetical protein